MNQSPWDFTRGSLKQVKQLGILDCKRRTGTVVNRESLNIFESNCHIILSACLLVSTDMYVELLKSKSFTSLLHTGVAVMSPVAASWFGDFGKSRNVSEVVPDANYRTKSYDTVLSEAL